MLAAFPVEKLSMMRTFWFCRSSASAMCEPMNPAPPVTTYVDMSPPQANYKPSSVLRPACAKQSGDHSSRLRVSPKLEQPTRKPERAVHSALRHRVSLFGLAPCGVYKADPSPDRWCALTAPFQ